MRINNFYLFRSRRKLQTISFNLFQNENSSNKRNNSMDNSSSFSSNSSKINGMNDEQFSTEKKRKRCSLSVFCIILALFNILMFTILYFHHTGHVKYEFSFLNQTISPKKELPPPPVPSLNQCQILNDADKLDCFPQGKVTKASCEQRGCCWASEGINMGVPYCFYSLKSPTYDYLNVTETAFGLEAYLGRKYRTPFHPNDVEIIKLTVKYETETRLHIKITDPLVHRFEPGYPEIPIVDKAASNLLYEFSMENTKPGFKIIRKSDRTVIFDAMEFRNLIFSNQFLQISGKLPSNYVYGLGEHRENFLLPLNWTKLTFFNHDAIPAFNKNLYGSHPFYLVMENSTKAHGVFLLNSNAMDVILQPTPAITYRTIGGVLDFFFFLGPKPSDVVSQYLELIGKPFLPPYWGLGFHLCRFGYKTINETRKIMERNIAAGIPLDTQWNDLDYMNNSNDFTYDKTNFRGLPEFIDELHVRGMHYIPLIDPGVSASESKGTYPPYDVGVEMDIFVKNTSDQIFVGKVWNKGTTVWPDFTNPNSVDYWTLMLKNFHRKINFDGAWIDMNEPSNFYSGSLNGCPQNEFEHPPYVPDIDGGVLYYKTMCMSCKHYAGLHYNVHNLYGLTEAIVTNFALAEIRGKRPMVIGRSTFPGYGHYAGHWSGDVWSSWNDMRYTIPQLLSFSLFGVPLMGADICGFNGNSTAQLCNRWMQLGAFYPFSRNHNTDDGIDQDPVAFGELVVNSSVKALRARYSLLPYLYTLFWSAHTKGDTVARPLFFEFSEDRETYSIDTQFLWGPALMIIPVLQENVETVRGYLPKSVWYNFYTSAAIYSEGEYFNISAPFDTIPLFIRGGFIIPQQKPKQTTTESRNTSIELLVALDEHGYAVGKLYWDDGDSLNTFEEKQFSLSEFKVDGNMLDVSNIYRANFPPNLGKVTVLGVQKIVNTVTINGNSYENFRYDPVLKVLYIEKLDLEMKKIVFIWK